MSSKEERAAPSGMESLLVTGTVVALKALSLLYDVVTYPVSLVLYRPWTVKERQKRVRAEPISSGPGSITYRSLCEPRPMAVQLRRENINTMESLFKYVVRLHRDKKCFGTRRVLAEEDEPQKSGKIFKKYVLGDYEWHTFAEAERLAASFGRGLREIGQQPKQNCAVFAETREEWMLAAQGCYKQNIPVVTLYATLGDDAIAHGINETEAMCVITSHELLPKFQSILQMTPSVKYLIYMEDQLKKTDTSGFKEGVQIIAFSEIVRKGTQSDKVGAPPTPDDIAIIMYTSGSTGVPKGVTLTHRNLLSSLSGFTDILDVKHDDVYLGYLPLAHVLEMISESLCLLYGVPVGYSTPLTMTDTSSKVKKGSKGDATVLQPTILACVPLILDRIYKGIQDKVEKGGSFGYAVFQFAYKYRLQWMKRNFDTPILNRFVFGKVRQLLGGKVRLILSGGAPLSPDTHEFIKVCLCCPLLQGYGLTETCASSTCMDLDDISMGRVGPPLSCSYMRLVDWEEGNYRVTDKPYPRGEIVIGGDNIATGYYKNPEKTKEDFFEEDGRRWFRTGDVGEIHPDGCLKIIDRKKDLVKLQFGEYVSLGKVESVLKTCPLVDNVCIYGDPSKLYTVALVVPEQKQLKEFATKLGLNGMPFEDLCADQKVEKAVLKELQVHGKKSKLEKFEIPDKVTLCKEVWSPDMDLVTAAFKIKRKNIQSRYQSDINRMYAS